jgi:hypothetical protein
MHIGDKFNYWTVMSFDKAYAQCKCKCGRIRNIKKCYSC